MGSLFRAEYFFAIKNVAGYYRKEAASTLLELLQSLFDNKVVLDYFKGQIRIDGVVDSVTYNTNRKVSWMKIAMTERLIQIARQRGWEIYRCYKI